MAAAPHEVTIDTWTPLAHKASMQPAIESGANRMAPTWVGKRHTRRLTAYRVLAMYLSNSARFLLTDADRAQDQREYGDPTVLVKRVRAALLGRDWTLSVDGADDEGAEPPDDPGPEATPEDRAQFTEALAEHTRRQAEAVAASERQEWLLDWSDDERLTRKVIATEDDCVGLGDGVYELKWSNAKGRVRVHPSDPGFYFPVLDDSDDEYPQRVHLAWQYDDDDDVTWVRRRTYELRSTGLEASTLPYHGPDDDPTDVRCYVTDARWRYDGLKARHLDDFDMRKAEIIDNADGEPLLDYDLGIDFIPVVHVPNTADTDAHFGRSLLSNIAQVLDDLAMTDTDTAITATIVGAPPIVISGAQAGGTVIERAPDTASPIGEQAQVRSSLAKGMGAAATLDTYGPGQVFWTGDGRLDVLDTSRSLDALLKFVDHLLRRASVNSQVPEEIIGRVRTSDVASGFLLLLGMEPFRSLIEDYRLVRDEKYRLLLKFVQRLAIVGGALEGPVLDARIAFGPWMPADVANVVEMVLNLLAKHGVARRTAITMLREAGIPIEDVADEIEAIEREDFEGAAALADALGDEQAAAEYLQRAEPAPAAPPLLDGLPTASSREAGPLPPDVLPPEGAAPAT